MILKKNGKMVMIVMNRNKERNTMRWESNQLKILGDKIKWIKQNNNKWKKADKTKRTKYTQWEAVLFFKRMLYYKS